MQLIGPAKNQSNCCILSGWPRNAAAADYRQCCTYGLRNIMRNMASGPRWKSALSASLMCSLAALRSSADGMPAAGAPPSSSKRNRYRKHLSLNGCSLLTASRNNVLTTVLNALIASVAIPPLTHHVSVRLPRAAPATCPPPGRVCARWVPNSPASPLAPCPVHTCVLTCPIPVETKRGGVSSWLQLQSQLAAPSLTLRSFKQLELSTTNKVRSAQPMRFIAGLGDYPRGSNVSNKRRRYITCI